MRKNAIFSVLPGLLLTLILTTSCMVDSCYDEEVYQANKDNACPQDCPGVTGCDGKTYCNECVALGQGISVIE